MKNLILIPIGLCCLFLWIGIAGMALLLALFDKAATRALWRMGEKLKSES
jgi:hypothetical protein